MGNGAEKGTYKLYWLKFKYQEKQQRPHRSFLSDLLKMSEWTKLISVPQIQNAENVREITKTIALWLPTILWFNLLPTFFPILDNPHYVKLYVSGNKRYTL